MVPEELIKAIAVTAELTGTELSAAAARVMCEDLSAYPPEQVMRSLQRCRRELKGRLTVAEIIARIDDGRPGPNEAWAMLPKSEEETVIWTEEMARAAGVANPLIAAGDQIAARMAFIEAYQREMTQARAERLPPKWRVSLGSDLSMRERVIGEAVRKGLISTGHAKTLLPHGEFQEGTPLLENRSGATSIKGIVDGAQELKKLPAAFKR